MDSSERNSDSDLPLDDSHLELGEVSHVLGHGFGDGERRRQVFLHFWAGCSVCHDRLEAEEVPPRTDPPNPDPLVLTLRTWLDVRDRPELVLPPLRPTLRHFLERVPDERSRFRRAFPELGYELATHCHPRESVEILESVVQDISDPRLESDEELHDLRGLALAHLAEAFQVNRDLFQAEEHFRRARDELSKGSGDPEILATFYELEADLLQAGGAPALRNLEDATVLLERAAEIPGRRAEHLARKGIALVQTGETTRGAEVFAEARSSLAASGIRSPRLELEIGHRLASAEVADGRFEEALRHLREIEPLYRDFATELVSAQRRWLEGTSLLRLQCHREAEGPLLEAFNGYKDLHLWEGATSALISLGQLFVLTGQSERFRELERNYVSQLSHPASLELVLARLRRAVQLAKQLEVPVPHLEEVLARLEKEIADKGVN